MEYIKNYKIFEAGGDNVPDDDKTLLLLKDLTLEISDLDPNYKIDVSGFGTYGQEGHNDYHVSVESDNNFSIYDVNKYNINELDSFNFNKIEELNKVCKELIKRTIDNGLYLCSYDIKIKSAGFYFNIRFIKREDGKPMEPNYKYAKDEIY